MVKLPRIRRPRLTGWPKLHPLSSVRGRIIAGFGLLVLILVVVVAGSARLHRQHLSDLSEMEEHAEISTLLDSARFETTSAALILQRYIITGDETQVTEFRSSVSVARNSLEQARAHVEEIGGSDEQAARLARVLATIALLDVAAEGVITLRQDGEAQSAAAVLDGAVPGFEQFTLELEEIAETERQQVAALRSEAESTGDLVFWLLVLSGVLGGALALAASALVARSILRPLSSLESAALAVAGGDLEARAPATGPREFARLGASLNRMTDSLLDASKRRELEAERERAFARLSESETRFRTLAETAAAAIFIFQGTRIRYVNAAAEAIAGYTRQEWLAMNFWDAIHPDSRELVRERGIARQRGQEIPSRYEVKLLTKKGEERWVDFTAAVIEFEGKPATLGTAFDITERKRAEEALRATKERLRHLLTASPAVIYSSKASGDFGATFISENVTSQLGYEAREFVEDSSFWGDHIHPEDAPRIFAELSHLFERGHLSHEYRFLHKDGTYRWMHDEMKLVRDSEGNPLEIVGYWFDITEQRQAEEALRESEEWLSTTLTSIGDAVIATDQDGRVTFLNPVAQSLTGWKREDAAGMSLTDILNIVSEQTGKPAENPVARVIREGAVVGLANDTVLIAKDGTRRPIEDSAAPIRDSMGSVIGVVLVFHDVTERRRAEEALRESEERTRLIVETAHDAFVSMDARGVITAWNGAAETIFGWSRDEALGRTLADMIVPAQIREGHSIGLKRFLATGEGPVLNKRIEITALHRGGHEFPVELAVWVVGCGDDRTFNAFVHDITERKRAEDALRHRVELESLVADISTNFINLSPEEIDGTMSRALQTIGGFADVDRSYVFLLSDDGAKMDNTHEWCAEGIEPQIENLQELPVELTPWWMEKLNRFENIHIPRVADLPPEATTEREILQAQDIRSVIIVPLAYGGSLIGFLGFDSVRTEKAWMDADVSLLKMTGEIFANALQRRRTEEALQEADEKYRTLVKQASDYIIILQHGKAVYLNPSYAQLVGYTAAETADRSFLDFVAPEDRARVQEYYQKRLRGEPVPDQYELGVLTKDGRRVTMEVKPRVIQYRGEPATMMIQRDITERKRAEEELWRANQQLAKDRQEIEALNRSLEKKVKERTRDLYAANEKLRQRHRDLLDARAQAATDALTDLSNHRAFHERIREEVRRAQETGSPIGLIMLDIDGFKVINDSHGHLAGDEILRGMAQTLADVTPREDAYRYGGDEFAVMLPGVDSRKTTRVAERLRRAVERRISNNGESVTVSLGIASFPDMVASADELIYGADAAMYWAKSAGKNRVGDWGKLFGQREGGALPWYAADRSVKAPDVVAALAAALAAKDPTTAGHTERCSWYALKLAEELGLPDEETSVVRLASLLHDIGKLAIPDEVLLKPGQLNEEEWAQMKQHPTAALHVLSHIRSLTDATPAILHHHEHFDGSGYPDGLAGEEIPIASRILLVTDAFDAMTTDRPYRKAMPIEVAIEELKRCSGSQFDPAIVDAFLSLLAREGAQPLRRMAAARPRPVAAGAAGSGRRER